VVPPTVENIQQYILLLLTTTLPETETLFPSWRSISHYQHIYTTGVTPIITRFEVKENIKEEKVGVYVITLYRVKV
jgi:hypothetical protein